MKHAFRLLAFFVAFAQAFAAPPTTGQFLFQRKTAGPFDQFGVTPVTGQSFGWDGTNVVMLSNSGGGTWGSITGTLSAQTDLQSALNLKLSLAGVLPMGGFSSITGTLPIANGGTNATTAAGARTNLGTTVGANLLGLTNPSAISFLRVNADNTVDALSASLFRTAIGAGTGSGTVTAVSVASANGISGTSSGGATPALTLALGNITPTTVNGFQFITSVDGLQIADGTFGSGAFISLGANASISLGNNAVVSLPDSAQILITAAKSLSVSNTIALAGTDGSTLNIGVGGTLRALSFVTPGTGVVTALGINIGSAGAPVLFNGAGGTPSSITLTNATGLPTTGISGLAINGSATALATGTSLGGYGVDDDGKLPIYGSDGRLVATKLVNILGNGAALRIFDSDDTLFAELKIASGGLTGNHTIGIPDVTGDLITTGNLYDITGAAGGVTIDGSGTIFSGGLKPSADIDLRFGSRLTRTSYGSISFTADGVIYFSGWSAAGSVLELPSSSTIDAVTSGSRIGAISGVMSVRNDGDSTRAILLSGASGAFSIVGTTAGGNATAGNVGQTISSIVPIGSAVSLTTATPANITSISLTAGDWWVQANANFTETVATASARSAGVNTTSATVPTDGSEAYCGVQSTLVTELNSITPAWKRVNVSSTTTVYLVASATFSAGTVAAFGSLIALRASR